MSKRAAPRGPTKRSKREAERLFQLGDQWLAHHPGTPYIYRCWFEPGTGNVRRRTTGEPDLEQAKIILTEIVLGDVPDDPLDPKVVTIAAIKKFYMTHHGDMIRSKQVPERALQLILEYLKTSDGIVGAAKVSDFGIARQDGFVRWARDTHKLSCKTISTYLSMYKAALKFCSRPHLVIDTKGKEKEAQVLAYAPFVNDSEKYISEKTGLPLSTPRSWIPTDDELAAFMDACYTDASVPNQDDGEHVWRYAIIQLNTWARPEAIFELNVKQQVHFARKLIEGAKSGHQDLMN
jgi:hypothetical protein